MINVSIFPEQEHELIAQLNELDDFQISQKWEKNLISIDIY